VKAGATVLRMRPHVWVNRLVSGDVIVLGGHRVTVKSTEETPTGWIIHTEDGRMHGLFKRSDKVGILRPATREG
jgi:hypothetical protein